MSNHIKINIDHMVLADNVINEQQLGDDLANIVTMRLNQPEVAAKLLQQSISLPKLTINAEPETATSEWSIAQQIGEVLCKD